MATDVIGNRSSCGLTLQAHLLTMLLSELIYCTLFLFPGQINFSCCRWVWHANGDFDTAMGNILPIGTPGYAREVYDKNDAIRTKKANFFSETAS